MKNKPAEPLTLREKIALELLASRGFELSTEATGNWRENPRFIIAQAEADIVLNVIETEQPKWKAGDKCTIKKVVRGTDRALLPAVINRVTKTRIFVSIDPATGYRDELVYRRDESEVVVERGVNYVLMPFVGDDTQQRLEAILSRQANEMIDRDTWLKRAVNIFECLLTMVEREPITVFDAKYELIEDDSRTARGIITDLLIDARKLGI